MMIHQLVAASLLLRFLAVSAAGQRQQKGEFLASMAHVSAISKEELESTVSLMSVKGSKSASTIALQGATLSGYGVIATFSDEECTALIYGEIFPLSTCFTGVTDSGTTNFKYTATSSTYVLEEYSDNKCSTLLRIVATSDYTAACSATKDTFSIQSSYKAPTLLPVLYVR